MRTPSPKPSVTSGNDTPPEAPGKGWQRKPIDVAALRALTDQMPLQVESAGDFIRRMRDEDRY